MKRAAVLIGVNQTGDLPELKAAARSAIEMQDWAREQGMDTELVTDSEHAVDPGRIRAAVEKFVLLKETEQPYDQLLVYFAGHGVNLRYSEYWLLSKAPGDTQAAVNVYTSTVLARYCGVKHIVFISDACRTAADTVKAQFVTGSEIFPNLDVSGVESPVDLFYACTLGRPAYEVRDAKDAARRFNAAYTGALLSALQGRITGAVDWESDAPPRGYVRMRQLKRALSEKVPAMMAEAGVSAEVFQQPDAHIASDDAAWIAELPPAGNPAKTYRSGGTRRPAPHSLPEPVLEAFSWILRQSEARGADPVEQAPASAAALLTRAARIAQAPRMSAAGAGSFETVGTTLFQAWAQGAPVQRTGPASVRIESEQRRLVLLELGNARLALLPAFPGYRATLSVDSFGELIDVAYEGAAPASGESGARAAASTRLLASVAAVASLDGRFDLDEYLAAQLAERLLHESEAVDPALALYAAYADSGRGRVGRAALWNFGMHRDFGATWPDLVILAHPPNEVRDAWAGQTLVLPFPARVTGWSALDAFNILLAPELAPLRASLTQSPWTLFEPAAAPYLHRLIKGEAP